MGRENWESSGCLCLLEVQLELMVMDLGVEWDELGMGWWCPQELLGHPGAVLVSLCQSCGRGELEGDSRNLILQLLLR